jgi:hypothetical protein
VEEFMASRSTKNHSRYIMVGSEAFELDMRLMGVVVLEKGLVDRLAAGDRSNGCAVELLGWKSATLFWNFRMGKYIPLYAETTSTLRAFLYNSIPMTPTIRDPKARRIDTTPIGTDEFSNTSSFFADDGVDDEAGVDASAEDKAEVELGRAMVEGWASCDMYVIG